MFYLLNLSHCVKRYDQLCQILACFTMIIHQIWSCQVVQITNLERFKLWPNFTFNFWKSLKFLVEQPSTSEVISQNLINHRTKGVCLIIFTNTKNKFSFDFSGRSSARGALECNLTGRCPFLRISTTRSGKKFAF